MSAVLEERAILFLKFAYFKTMFKEKFELLVGKITLA